MSLRSGTAGVKSSSREKGAPGAGVATEAGAAVATASSMAAVAFALDFAIMPGMASEAAGMDASVDAVSGMVTAATGTASDIAVAVAGVVDDPVPVRSSWLISTPFALRPSRAMLLRDYAKDSVTTTRRSSLAAVSSNVPVFMEVAPSSPRPIASMEPGLTPAAISASRTASARC